MCRCRARAGKARKADGWAAGKTWALKLRADGLSRASESRAEGWADGIDEIVLVRQKAWRICLSATLARLEIDVVKRMKVEVQVVEMSECPDCQIDAGLRHG